MAEVRFNDTYYTVIHIVVDVDAAKEFVDEYNETEPEEYKSEWTGNIWDFFEDGPTSRMNEDNVLPASVDWWDDVELDECCEELYSDDEMSIQKNICVYCWEVLEDDERTLYPTMEDEADMISSF